MLIKHYPDSKFASIDKVQYYMPEAFETENKGGKIELTMYFPYGPKKITVSTIEVSDDGNIIRVYNN
jgi:hypothetical protein